MQCRKEQLNIVFDESLQINIFPIDFSLCLNPF